MSLYILISPLTILIRKYSLALNHSMSDLLFTGIDSASDALFCLNYQFTCLAEYKSVEGGQPYTDNSLPIKLRTNNEII